VEGGPITWSISQAAAHGTATVSGTGTTKTVYYTPTNDYNGSDTFDVQVSDSDGGVDQATVNITINPRNDAPGYTTSPSVSGNHHVGQSLSLYPGTWNDNRDQPPGLLTYIYQWRRAENRLGLNAIDLPGKTNLTYVIQSADDQHYLQAMLSVSDDGVGAPPSMTTTVATAWTLAIDVSPSVTITTLPHTVPMEVSSASLAGTNNAYVVGTMWVSNAANDQVSSFDASPVWNTFVPLEPGANPLVVFGANQYGTVDSDTIIIQRLDLTGPRVLAHQPLRVNSTIDTLTLSFSESINPATFGTDDVTLIDPGTNLVTIHTVSPLSTHTFQIDVAQQSTEGIYTLRIGPNIYDLADDPNPMDQDQDGSTGETSDDQYQGEFEIDLSGPKVIAHSLTNIQHQAARSIIITFNEPMDPASLDPNLLTVAGPCGTNTALTATANSATTALFTLSPCETNGFFFISLAPTVTDVLGHLLDQDDDGIPGEPVEDLYQASFQQQLPDLVVSVLQGPVEAQSQQEIVVEWSILNQGEGVATGSWSDAIYIASNAVPAQDDLIGPLGSLSYSSSLDPNASYTRIASLSLPVLTQGAWWLVLVADYNQTLDEQNAHLNNTTVAASPISVTTRPGPDLQVSNLLVSAVLHAGEEATISWTVLNAGEVASSASVWYDRVYLSSDTHLNVHSDIQLEPDALNPEFLASEESYEQTVSFELPENLSGSFYLFVYTDAENHVEEFHQEQNNVSMLSTSVVVIVAPPAVLEVTSILAPDSAQAGNKPTVTWTVENRGGQTIPGRHWWTDEIRLSTNDIWGDSDDVVLSRSIEHQLDSLKPGASYIRTQQIERPLPTTWAPGPYHLLVSPDVTLLANVNYRQHGTNSLQLEPFQPADLAPVEINAPPNARAGQPIQLDWTVQNIGAGDTKHSYWEDALFLSTNATRDESDIRLGKQSHDGALITNQTYQVQEAAFTLPNGWEGEVHLLLQTDDKNHVYENVETNNLLAQPITINLERIDLEVSSASTVAQQAVAGEAILVEWSVLNSGVHSATGTWSDACYLSTNLIFDPVEDIRLGEFMRPVELDSLQSYTQTNAFPLPARIEGDYHLFMVCDSRDQLYEYQGEENNVLRIEPALTITDPVADLIAVGLNAPTNAFAGQSLSLSWHVTNAGVVAADAPWTDAIYLSTNATFDPGTDLHLTSAVRNSDLATQTVYRVTNSLTLPGSIEGSYHLIFVTDLHHEVYEKTFTTNNIFVQSIQLIDQAADLANTSVIAPSNAVAGELLPVSWGITNAGTAPAYAPWVDALYLSSNGTFEPAIDTELVSISHDFDLPVSLAYSISNSLLLPDHLEGSFHLLFVTDAAGEIYEKGITNNNLWSHSIELIDYAPDLIVTNIIAPTNAMAGHLIDFSWQVTNAGMAIAQAPWIDAVYLSTDTLFQAQTDTLLFSSTQTNDLSAAASYTFTNALTLPDAIEGPYYLLCVADRDGDIYEKGRTNNQIVVHPIELTDQAPDLQVDHVQAPEQAAAGGTLSVTWQVANHGPEPTPESYWVDGIYLSSDGILDPAFDLQLGLIPRRGALQPGETYTHAATVALREDFEGMHTVYVEADTWNQVYERHLETNNVTPAALATRLFGVRADLRILQLDAPWSADAGEPITVEWQVENSGFDPTPVAFWEDALYLSEDAQLDTNDLQLAIIGQHGALLAGEGYTKHRLVTLPTDLSGSLYLILKTDANTANHVFEYNAETNNVAALEIQVNATPAPDLQVTTIDVPTNAWSGQQLPIEWTVQNTGLGQAVASSGHWYDSLYLSRDTYLDRQTDLKLGNREQRDPLAATAETNAQQTARLDKGVTGPFYLLALTDSTDQIDERDAEDNNLGISSSTIDIALPPPSDLQVTEVIAPTNAVVFGEPAAWGLRVTNSGLSAAVGSWWDTLYLSTNTVWDVDDPRIARIEHTNDLAVGEHYEAQTFTHTPPVLPGDYHLIARADIFDDIREDNLFNNLGLFTGLVHVVARELVVDQTVTNDLTADQFVYYQLVVSEGNDVLIALSNAFPNQVELYIGRERMPSRGDFDLRGIRQSDPRRVARIPGGVARTYYILIQGRSDLSPSSYTLSATRPGLSATQLSTTSAGNTGSATITIDGYDLGSNTLVRLEDAEVNLVDQGTGTLNSEGQLIVTFNLLGVTPGTYTLVLENPGGSTISAPFTVTDGQGADLFANVIVPSVVRIGRPYSLTLEYGNQGDVDALAPLIQLRPGAGAQMRAMAQDSFSTNGVQIMGLADDHPVNVLPPGSSYSLELDFMMVVNEYVPFYVQLVSADQTAPVGWANFEEALRPDGIDSNEWDQAWANLQTQLGSTWGSYVAMLGNDTARLALRGQPTTLVSDLFAFEWGIAFGAGRGAIAGLLLDAETGTPISSALLNAHDVSGTLRGEGNSDADGTFLIDDLHPHLYTVSAESYLMEGYVSGHVTATHDATDVILEVIPGGEISGRVETLLGEPLEQIAVTLTGEESDISRELLTDAIGAFEFGGLPADVYTVQQSVSHTIQLVLADREIRDGLILIVEEAGEAPMVDPISSPDAPIVSQLTETTSPPDAPLPPAPPNICSVSKGIDITVDCVDLDVREPNGAGGVQEVPDDREASSGALLVSGETELLVQDPGIDTGMLTLSWPASVAPGKRLEINGYDEGTYEIDCSVSSFPRGLYLTTLIETNGDWVEGSWDITNSVIVSLSHSDRPDCSDEVRLAPVTVDLSVDYNRDQKILFTADDRTTPETPYRFWLNNDWDVDEHDMSWANPVVVSLTEFLFFISESHPLLTILDLSNYELSDLVVPEDFDPSMDGVVADKKWNGESLFGPFIDCQDSKIKFKRDLEDFSALGVRIKASNKIIQEIHEGSIEVSLLFKHPGSSMIDLYRAVDQDGTLLYLNDESIAASQVGSDATRRALYRLSFERPFTFPVDSEDDLMQGLSPLHSEFYLLFEGCASGGLSELALSLKKEEVLIAESPPVHLELKDVREMYEHYTVGDTTDMAATKIPSVANEINGFLYTEDSPEEEDYILFVHGWRMQPWERRAFADTTYKRLFWAGYRGRFGFFSWPTEWTSSPGGLMKDMGNFDRSEHKAWYSARGLHNLLVDLNNCYPGKVRVMAHSQGNTVVSQALRYEAEKSHPRRLVHTYVASQAATAAHAYDPNVDRYLPSLLASTPDIYRNYPPTKKPYFFGISSVAEKIINFHNKHDFALRLFLVNHLLKPDIGWGYGRGSFAIATAWLDQFSTDQWYQGTPPNAVALNFPTNTFEIYSFIAEARSRALGHSGSTRGEIDEAVDLNAPPFSFGAGPFHHSGQFLSLIHKRLIYWERLLDEFQIQTP